jgi:hypothetical protein
MKSMKTSGPSGRQKEAQIFHAAPCGDDRPRVAQEEPVVCRTCGALWREGRWQWLPLPARAKVRRSRCPACLRGRADDPAGVVTLVGGFVRLHAEELLQLIRHQEEREKQRDPQSRIVRIRRLLDRIDVTTTDTHLARTIGEAVEQAHGGTLHVMRGQDDNAIRIRWLGDEEPPATRRGGGPPPDRREACTSTRSQRITTARLPSTGASARRHSTH